MTTVPTATTTTTSHTRDGVYLTDEIEKRKDNLKGMALQKGALLGAATLGITSVATYVLNQRHAGFRNFAGISAKVSLPIIASLFVTSVATEHAIHDVIFNPEKWDGGKPVTSIKKIEPKVTDVSQLNPAKQLLLKVYDHPLVFAGTLALPLIGHILNARVAKGHLTLSQALMQTRVVGQFSVISILLATVSLRALVEYNDHFGFRRQQLTDDDKYSR